MWKLVVAGLVLAGCSNAAGASCEQIADDAAKAANEWAAQMENVDVLASEQPAAAEELSTMGDRFEEAGCSDDEITALMKERADQIEGEGLYAEMVRGMFLGEAGEVNTEPIELPSF